jgi:hypothetical protein
MKMRWTTVLISALFLPLSVLCQTAAITGTIADSTGARVPEASLTARNVETGVERSVKSNSDGYYNIPLLQPGKYGITVLKQGFKPVSRTGISLAIDQSARIDFVLEVGDVSQAVSVTSESPMLTTDSGALKQVIDQRRIVDLPLNGRNAEQLVLLAAGTVSDTRTRSTYVYGSSILPDTQTPSINGSRSNGVAYRLDGANNNDNYTGVSNPFPNPDALQEFSVQTNSFSAEFGNAPGGIVNIRTKSGTNQFHGTLFEFLRNGAVNARNYFAAVPDNLKRNQFGGTFGGPIVRDKVFFFGSYQGTRLRSTSGGLSQFSLTNAMKTGDFSQVSGKLSDPDTGNAFPGRQIPLDRMDPVSLKLLDYMPVTTDPSGRVTYSLPNRTNYNEYLIKSDQLWKKHQTYERYFQYDLNTPAIFPNKQILTQFTNGQIIRVRTIALNDVYTFTPSLLNSFTATIAYDHGQSTPAAPFGVADLGAKVAQPDVPQLGISISGYAGFSTTQRAELSRDSYEFDDGLTWIHGRHQVLFGTTVLRLQQDIVNDFRKNASFSFTNDFSGNSAANFLLGRVTSFTQGGGEYKALRGWRLNYYVQDNFRVSDSLTLNLGVRLDPWLPYTDELDRITCIIPGTESARYPNAPQGMLFAGDQGCPRGGTPSRIWNFAPRFGFAWSPRGHSDWSIRGGYGIFYEQPETVLYNRFVDTAPFSPTILLTGVQFSDPYRGTVNPFPAEYGPRQPPSTEQFVLPVLATTFDQGFIPDYTQNWNLTLEHQFGPNNVARLAYVGSKSTHLRTNIESNPAIYTSSATVGNTQQRRLNTEFSSIVRTLAAGNSSYNALQASFERRFSRNFSFVANYTYSKSIDYNSSNTTQGSSDVPNPFNLAPNRGVSDFDVPHRFVLSGVYALPQLKSSAALTRGILGGWQLSGLANWQSGFPFSVASGVDNSRSGIGSDRADYLGTSATLPSDRALQSVLNQYFNVAAFAPNALGTFGSSGRNILRGLSSFNVDMSAQKYFSITERYRLQFRGEFFNAANTPTFGLPGASLPSPSVGKILSASDPRILQFAIKVLF